MNKIKEFWGKYEYRIVLAVGFVLIAVISFEFGYMQGKDLKLSPLVIEKAPESSKNDSGSPTDAAQVSDTALAQKAPLADTSTSINNLNATQSKCAFVGSKNSDKFYPPSCSYAKRIKPENVVCFASVQEALAQGRIASTGCK